MSSLEFLTTEKKNSFWKGTNIMLFLYSVIVSFALMLVVSKKFSSDEEYVEQSDKIADYEVVETVENIADTSVTEVYEEENALTNNLAPEWEIEVQEDEPEIKVEVVEVK